MRRFTYVISVLFCLAVSVPAAAGRQGNTCPGERRDFPRFTFGVETSYVLTFLNYSHFNFISSDGGRRDERSLTDVAMSNGQILVSGGVNISDKLNLSLYTGYGGVYRRERMVPLSMRLSWYSGGDPMKNRWMSFCSVGAGFNNPDMLSRISAEGKAGGGYRISLNRHVKMDLLLAFQEVYTHIRAYENDTGSYVPEERLRRNDTWIGAFTFGIGLVF